MDQACWHHHRCRRHRHQQNHPHRHNVPQRPHSGSSISCCQKRCQRQRHHHHTHEVPYERKWPRAYIPDNHHPQLHPLIRTTAADAAASMMWGCTVMGSWAVTNLSPAPPGSAPCPFLDAVQQQHALAHMHGSDQAPPPRPFSPLPAPGCSTTAARPRSRAWV
eukprot:351082-Chlamydomonas_euryale.AAC.9